jgi:hypothetical protein
MPLISLAYDVDNNSHEIEQVETEDKKVNLAEPSLKLWHTMGWYFIIAIPLGVISALATIGFLWSLWTGNSSNKTWRIIMVNSLATRRIALTSLLLRTATSIQAGACTSMMAAVIFENGLFVLSTVAAVSTLRYVNGGPQSLLKLFLGRVGIRRKTAAAAFWHYSAQL